jgi:hypothetical protein
MIHGVVSRNREATISLVIVNENRQTKLITARSLILDKKKGLSSTGLEM